MSGAILFPKRFFLNNSRTDYCFAADAYATIHNLQTQLANAKAALDRKEAWYAEECQRIGVEGLTDETHEAEPFYLKNTRAEAVEKELADLRTLVGEIVRQIDGCGRSMNLETGEDTTLEKIQHLIHSMVDGGTYKIPDMAALVDRITLSARRADIAEKQLLRINEASAAVLPDQPFEIEIKWRDGAYYVSKPNFDGGVVVLKSDYLALKEKLDGVLKQLDEASFSVLLWQRNSVAALLESLNAKLKEEGIE